MTDFTDDKLQESPSKLLELAISLLQEAYGLRLEREVGNDHETYAIACLENSIQMAEEAFELLGGDYGD
jgi:hypothetical protein